MFELLTDLAAQAMLLRPGAVVLASDSDGSYLWLLGPAAGIGFYSLIYLRYRNTDKRHAFEHRTASEVDGVRTHDQRSGSVKGVENSRVSGDNSRSPRQRLGRASTVAENYQN